MVEGAGTPAPVGFPGSSHCSGVVQRLLPGHLALVMAIGVVALPAHFLEVEEGERGACARCESALGVQCADFLRDQTEKANGVLLPMADGMPSRAIRPA